MQRKGAEEHDECGEEWRGVVSRRHVSIAHLDEHGRYGAQAQKGATFEFEKTSAIRCGALGEKAEWVIGLAMDLNIFLTLSDLLNDLVARFLVRSSVDEQALEAAASRAK